MTETTFGASLMTSPAKSDARKTAPLITRAGVAHTYMEYGGYFSRWRDRLAIKLWSGWPTFPQVFVRGVLLGGEELTRAAIADGSLKASLDGGARVPAVA